MFTLGDVADILDSALDTGISIVDALAKLSDLADEGGLGNAKGLKFGDKTNNVYDENENIISENNVEFVTTAENNEENNLNVVSSDDSGMCSGSSLNFSNKSSDASNYRTHSDNASASSKTLSNPIDISCDKIHVLRGKSTSLGDCSKPTISQSITGNGDEILLDTFQRCGTYVLQSTKNRKDLEDNSFDELPVFQAFGNLCHIADDVLKYNHIDNTNVGSSSTDMVTESNSDALNLKVNDMLHSFQKLDATVEKLKQQAMQRHLVSHPEDKELLVAHQHSADRIHLASKHQLSSSDPCTPVMLRKHKRNTERPHTYQVDDYPPTINRKINNVTNDKNFQDSELFFNFQTAHTYSRQTSQETYILDDETEYDDDHMNASLSSDEKTEMRNDIQNKKSRDTYTLLNSKDNMKSTTNKNVGDMNHVHVDKSKPGDRSDANTEACKTSNQYLSRNILNRNSLLFYQEEPSSTCEPNKCKQENGLLNGEKRKSITANTHFDRNTNCRNTYVLHDASQTPNIHKTKVDEPLNNKNTHNLINRPTFLRKKTDDTKENDKTKRETYTLCKPGDPKEKVKSRNELKTENRRNSPENKTQLGMNDKIIQKNKSRSTYVLSDIDNSTKKDKNSNDVLVAAEPFTRSEARSTYILSKTDNITHRHKNKKLSNNVDNKDENNKVERRPEHLDEGESIVPSESGNKRSTYILMDTNKNKNNKKKLSLSKQINSEFLKNANTNNDEVMFYVGKKQNKNAEDEELKDSLIMEPTQKINHTEVNEEVLQCEKPVSTEEIDTSISDVSPNTSQLTDTSLQSIDLNETYDESSLSNLITCCETIEQITNTKMADVDRCDVTEEFELLYEINNPAGMEDVSNIKLDNKSNDMLEKSEDTSHDQQKDDSFQEFELIYEIAVPTSKDKNCESTSKENKNETVSSLAKISLSPKENGKSINNCAFMIPYENSSSDKSLLNHNVSDLQIQEDGVSSDGITDKSSDDANEITNHVISRENTFVKEENSNDVDCNEIAFQSDGIQHLRSRENTFVKDEVSADSIEKVGTKDEKDLEDNKSLGILDDASCVIVNGIPIEMNSEVSSGILTDVSSGILTDASSGILKEASSCEILNDATHETFSDMSHEILNDDSSSEIHDVSSEISNVCRSESAMLNSEKLYSRAASLDTLIDSNTYETFVRNPFKRSFSNPSSSEIKEQLYKPQKDLFKKLDTLQNLMSSSLTKLNTLNYFRERSSSFLLTSHENILDEVTCKEFNNKHFTHNTLEESSTQLSIEKDTSIKLTDENEDPESGIKFSTPTNMSTPPSFDLADETYSLASTTCSEKIEDNSYEECCFSPETYTIQSKTSSVEEICQFEDEWSEDIDIEICEQSHHNNQDDILTNLKYEKNKFLPLSGLFFSTEDNSISCENGLAVPAKSSVCRSDTFVVSPREEKKSKHLSNLGVSRNDTFLIDKHAKHKQLNDSVSSNSLKHNQSIEVISLSSGTSNNRQCYSAMNEYHCNEQVKISNRPLSAGCSQKPRSETFRKLKKINSCNENSTPDTSKEDSLQTCLHPISFFYTLDTSTFSTSMTNTKKTLPTYEKLTYSNQYTKPTEIKTNDEHLFYTPGSLEDAHAMCNHKSEKDMLACESELQNRTGCNGKTPCAWNTRRRMVETTPIYTNFLRRKSEGYSKKKLQNKENEDETLSVQLAALRMQLEEKRRKFDEEKKRKQEQWREERAKNLQNAFFIMLNNEEQKPVDLSASGESENWQESTCEPQLVTQNECQEQENLQTNTEKPTIYDEPEIMQIIEKVEAIKNIETEHKECLISNEETDFDETKENKMENKKVITDSTTTIAERNVDIITLETNEQIYPMETQETIPVVEILDEHLPLCTLIQEFSPFSKQEVPQTKPVGCPTSISYVLNELGNTDTSQLTTIDQFGNTDSPELSTVLNEVVNSNTIQELNINNDLKQNMMIVGNDEEMSYFATHFGTPTNTLPDSELQISSHDNMTDIVHTVIETVEKPKSLTFIENEQVPNATIDSVLAQVGSSPLASLNYMDILPSNVTSIVNESMHSSFPQVIQTTTEMSTFEEDIVVQDEIPRFENILSQEEEEEIPTTVENLSIHMTCNEEAPFQQQSVLMGSQTHGDNADEVYQAQNITPEKVSDVLSQENIVKTPNAMTFVVGVDMMGTPELTPQQIKKRERFLKQRQKNMEEEKERKAAELEKKQRMEENTPKKISKEERPKEAGNMYQDSLIKRLGNEQTPQETPKKSKRDPLTPRTPRTPQQQPTTPASCPTTDEASRYAEYTGPDAYKKPTGKSNRKIIQNAIMHCCLCGEVNKDSKKKCLDALEKSEANHFLVLFREGLKFRSVYEYHPESETVTRVYGIGPKTINEKMMIKYYKYNSGGKEFYSLETKHLSIQVDGLMIKKELWEKKQANSSKTDSNLKKFLGSSQK